MKTTGKTILGFVTAAGLMALSQTGAAGNKSSKDPFLKFAQDLMPIADMRKQQIKSQSNGTIKRQVRVAIWPFQKDKIPIAKTIADNYNDRLLARLLKLNDGKIEFVARDALKTIIDDKFQTGALDKGDQPIAALMENASNIDVLIQGKIRTVGKGISLAYKAVGMDGKIIAQTLPALLTLKQKEKNILDNLLTIDQIISGAANSFVNNASDMIELKVGGLYFQDTGIQTPFSIFLKEQIISSIQRKVANVLTDRRIKVVGVGSQGNLKKGDPGYYVFKGRYWILGRNLEIQLGLDNLKTGGVSWSGRIPTSYIKRLKYRPSRNFEHLRANDGLGPFEFELKSKKGTNPVYRIGEQVKLKMRVSEDTWMYCFYHQANGEIIQIFPNPHFWKRQSSPMLVRNKWHKIPDKKLFPFALEITKPAGVELIKCFGSSRDITRELPRNLRGRSLSPMAKDVLNNASKLFSNFSKSSVAEASIVITVIE